MALLAAVIDIIVGHGGFGTGRNGSRASGFGVPPHVGLDDLAKPGLGGQWQVVGQGKIVRKQLRVGVFQNSKAALAPVPDFYLDLE